MKRLGLFRTALWPLGIIFSLLAWPLHRFWNEFGSYIVGTVYTNEHGYPIEVRFCHYDDRIYFLPMLFASVLLGFLSLMHAPQGILMITWWFVYGLCIITITTDMDIWQCARAGIYFLTIVALSYVTEHELGWNFLGAIGSALWGLGAEATSGFFFLAAVFYGIFVLPVLFDSWFNKRVKLDYKYVYLYRWMRKTDRRPIFARAVSRDTKDMLERLFLRAADVICRVQEGRLVFHNVPSASGRLADALDRVVDYRPPGDPRGERQDIPDYLDPADAGLGDQHLDESEDEDCGGGSEDFEDDAEVLIEDQF